MATALLWGAGGSRGVSSRSGSDARFGRGRPAGQALPERGVEIVPAVVGGVDEHALASSLNKQDATSNGWPANASGGVLD